MLRVDSYLFANVITSIQRTGSLTGGAVRGLPNGVVIEGLKGINSFGSDIAEAQKEFELGRIRSCLERVKQIEMHFNGIVGRWNATVGTVISSARQGNQKLSLQKLNEVKNAQTKMQQLAGPASKAFRDLVAALELAVSLDGRTENPVDPKTEPESVSDDQPAVEDDSGTTESTTASSNESRDDTPDVNLLGSFAANYRFGSKLETRVGADKKSRVVPKLEENRFYFLAGFDPPSVVRVREIRRKELLVYDSGQSREFLIDAGKLRTLLRRGIWLLESKKSPIR